MLVTHAEILQGYNKFDENPFIGSRIVTSTDRRDSLNYGRDAKTYYKQFKTEAE
jgi:hypothetical protein